MSRLSVPCDNCGRVATRHTNQGGSRWNWCDDYPDCKPMSEEAKEIFALRLLLDDIANVIHANKPLGDATVAHIEALLTGVDAFVERTRAYINTGGVAV